jgi:hypothetical protein
LDDTILENTNGSPAKDQTAFGQKSVISDYTVANTPNHPATNKLEEIKEAPKENPSH